MSQLERIQENKRRGGKKQQAAARDWHGFVDVPLSQQDKETLAEASFSAEDASVFLESATTQGYKVSVSPDWARNCCIATVTGSGDKCPNLGWSMSARGPDAHGALMALAYKMDVITKWGAWDGIGESRDNSPFG